MSAEEITLLRSHLERAVARYEKAEERLAEVEAKLAAAAACDMAPGDLAFDDDGYPVTVVVGAIVVVERANGARYGVPVHTLKPRES